MPITTCDSPAVLRAEIDIVRKKVVLDETEETWDTIAQGILLIIRLCNNGGCEFPLELVAGIRSMSRPLNNALNSERSRLSGAAVELLTALATGLGSSFEPLVSQFVPALLALCGRTNKVFTSRAKACILVVIQHTRLPSLLPYLAEMANHKSVFPRLVAAEGILACLNCFNPPDLEKETRARVVEDFIKLTARDASADVRKASKEVFKAYKALMPARVDSFVAPLTPVVKKYLDIQTGPLGSHAGSSNAAPKQTSRPSSRANNKVAEAVQRPPSSMLSKPPVRPVVDDHTRQRPVAHDLPTTSDVRAPRQRTMSQIQRDPPQPRGLHINTQYPSGAQRCAISTSVPARQAVQPGVTRAPPARTASSTGPQRPPPGQMKFNPPPDRLKPTGNGAKRIPLPSAPGNGHASEPGVVAARSVDRVGGTVDQPRSKVPTGNAETAITARSAVSRKPSEGVRPTSSSIKPVNGSTSMGPTAVKRLHNASIKSGANNPNRIVPGRRPTGNVQKVARPPVKTERKVTSPTHIPLPPSPSAPPTEVSLPPSPDCMPGPTGPEVEGEHVVATTSGPTNPVGEQLKVTESCQVQGDMKSPSTPITTLLSSIQRGFLFTPSSPLSPPQNYLPVIGDLQPKRQNAATVNEFAKGPFGETPFCMALEDDSAADSLVDRHALREIN